MYIYNTVCCNPFLPPPPPPPSPKPLVPFFLFFIISNTLRYFKIYFLELELVKLKSSLACCSLATAFTKHMAYSDELMVVRPLAKKAWAWNGNFLNARPLNPSAFVEARHNKRNCFIKNSIIDETHWANVVGVTTKKNKWLVYTVWTCLKATTK